VCSTCARVTRPCSVPRSAVDVEALHVAGYDGMLRPCSAIQRRARPIDPVPNSALAALSSMAPTPALQWLHNRHGAPGPTAWRFLGSPRGVPLPVRQDSFRVLSLLLVSTPHSMPSRSIAATLCRQATTNSSLFRRGICEHACSPSSFAYRDRNLKKMRTRSIQI
jgi:hypothetical protein